jgi:hypothetical protein
MEPQLVLTKEPQISFIKAQSRLIIGGRNCLMFELPQKKPCWFHRFWQKLLLGFEWEDVKL